MKEEIFYNALNILLESNYRELAKLKNKNASWKIAWENCASNKEKKIDPEKEYECIADSGARIILYESDDYPSRLKEISDPPFGIYVLGSLPEDDALSIAIVGTRGVTSEGKNIAKNFANALAKKDLVIVSGLALGVDAAAHAGCLEAGGKTVAVLGNGIGSFYPRTNEKIAKKIIENGGAVISEYPTGASPLPRRFLERNRVVAGISKGVLIVEAPERSGSLVTARLALEENRDVFAVPGPINHPNYRGSNQLIRRGAELVTKPEEILEAWGLETNPAASASEKFDNEEERIIFDVLSREIKPLSADEISEASGLNISEINRLLTFMTLKNLIAESDRGYTVK